MRPSTLEAALAEAAFMTGFERNADVVQMSAYAPLLAHVDGWQWTPNLIWFDNLRSFGTPSYYAQQMFGANRGSRALPIDINGSGANGTEGIYASAAIGAAPDIVIVKLVNPGPVSRTIRFTFPPGIVARVGSTVTALAGDLHAENTLANPTLVAPAATFDSDLHDHPLPPHSFTVFEFGVVKQ